MQTSATNYFGSSYRIIVRTLTLYGMVVGVLSMQTLCAADFYVSNSGNNANTGASGNPWLTLAHALSNSSNGSTIHLARNSIFREYALTLSGGKTLQTVAGAGAQAEIRGSKIVTGFVSVGGGVYKATVNGGANVEQVYVNGVAQTLARYPNVGWLRTDAGSSNNSIVDSETSFTTAGQWVGGQVRWRKWSWWYETRPIVANNGSGTLSLGGSTSGNNTGIGSGYYVDNILAELDIPGEWFWDSATDELYVYPSVNPGTMVVEAAIRAQALSVNGATLNDIAISQFTGAAVGLNNAVGTVSNCFIHDIGLTGISVSWNAGGSTISNNTIEDVLNVGINWNENPASGRSSLIEHNQINRIGTKEGYGGSGPWHAAGIIVNNADNLTIRYNRFNYIGYAGIILGTAGQTVTRNVMSRCMATLNDGGAIYANASDETITENIILDTVGDLDSSHPWTPLGHGIWPEFLSEFRDHDISRNTVYGSGGAGLFLPNNYDCTIGDNIFLSNRTYGILLSGNDSASHPEQPGHTFNNNVLGIGVEPWSAVETQTLAAWASTDDVCLYFDNTPNWDFGTMSGTQFVTQDGNDLVMNDTKTKFTINQWQSNESSWADPSPLQRVGNAYLFINDSSLTRSMSLPSGITWNYVNGNSAGSSVSLTAFRSVVLIAASGDASAVDPYILYSETQQALRKITIRSSKAVSGWTLSSDSVDAATPTPVMSGSEGASSSLDADADYQLRAVPQGAG